MKGSQMYPASVNDTDPDELSEDGMKDDKKHESIAEK